MSPTVIDLRQEFRLAHGHLFVGAGWCLEVEERWMSHDVPAGAVFQVKRTFPPGNEE